MRKKMGKGPMKKNMGGMVNRPTMPVQANVPAGAGAAPAGMGASRGAQIAAMAQAPGRTGGIGQQVSAMRPGFRKGGMVGTGKPAMAGAGKPAMAGAGKPAGAGAGKPAGAGAGKPAGAGAGPSWKPAKTASGNYGQAVSAAAHARNAARKAARTKPPGSGGATPATPATPATGTGTGATPATPSTGNSSSTTSGGTTAATSSSKWPHSYRLKTPGEYEKGAFGYFRKGGMAKKKGK